MNFILSGQLQAIEEFRIIRPIDSIVEPDESVLVLLHCRGDLLELTRAFHQ